MCWYKMEWKKLIAEQGIIRQWTIRQMTWQINWQDDRPSGQDDRTNRQENRMSRQDNIEN